MISNLAQPGARIVAEREQLLDALANLTKDLNAGRGKFPGAQPVSFQQAHLGVVKQSGDYLVCEKSDGNRYLLMLLGRSSYFVSPKMEFFRVEPPLPIDLSKVIGTLLDGELVHDIPDRNNPSLFETNFYIFDAISLVGQYVGALPLVDRLRLVAGEVLPHIFPQNGPVPMRLSLKRMFLAEDSRYVWENIIESGNLTHENDGLIYTLNKAPYFVGTATRAEILKWKPLHLNSVDFGIGYIISEDENGIDQKYFCTLHWGKNGKCVPYQQKCINLDEQTQEILRTKCLELGTNIIIVECSWDKNGFECQPPPSGRPWNERHLRAGGGWKFMRLRLDKPLPNNFKTVESVIYSIEHPLEPEELFKGLDRS